MQLELNFEAINQDLQSFKSQNDYHVFFNNLYSILICMQIIGGHKAL
jgi:hypothetical protein